MRVVWNHFTVGLFMILLPSIFEVMAYNHYGDINPEGANFLVGQTFNITCRVKCGLLPLTPHLATSCSSSFMYMKLRRKLLPTAIVDNVTIQYSSEKLTTANLGKSIYHCYMNRSNDRPLHVGLGAVKVGIIPKAKAITCTLPNWEKAICRWYANKNHTPGDSWILTYSTDNSSWDFCLLKGLSCAWSNFGVDFQRRPYYINITGSNIFGTSSKIFYVDFRDQELIVPDDSTILKTAVLSSENVTVTVKGPVHLAGLISMNYSVQLRSQFDTVPITKTVEKPAEDKSIVEVSFDSLIPNTHYTIRVKSRPTAGSKWSNETIGTFLTLEDVPARNPETRNSSYQSVLINTCRDKYCRKITTYYKDIPDRYSHGTLRKVIATFRTSSSSHDVKCDEVTRACLRDDFQMGLNYSVVITASTSKGPGPANPSSHQFIPQHGLGPKPPEYLIGEITEESTSNTSVRFMWFNDPDHSADNIVLYIRHCAKGTCEGGIDWVVLDGALNHTVLTLSHGNNHISEYKFSVASEKDGMSGGMSDVWLSCLYKIIGTEHDISLPSLEIPKRSINSIEVQWAPQRCKLRAERILSYTINIREVSKSGMIVRDGRNTTIDVVALPYTQSYTIDNLKENTFYNISLMAHLQSGSKQGQWHFNRTLAPVAEPVNGVVIAVGVLIPILIVGLLVVVIVWYYKKITDKHKQISIRRTPAPQAPESPPGLSAQEEYLERGRSESESSSNDGDPSNRSKELRKLIPNGRPTKGLLSHPQRLTSHDSGESAMTDVTFLPSESDNDDTLLVDSPKSGGYGNRTSDLQPVPEVTEECKPAGDSSDNGYVAIQHEGEGNVFFDFKNNTPSRRYVNYPPNPYDPPLHMYANGPSTHKYPRHVRSRSKSQGSRTPKDTASKGSGKAIPSGATSVRPENEYSVIQPTSGPSRSGDNLETDREGYLVPKFSGEVDEEGYMQPRSATRDNEDLPRREDTVLQQPSISNISEENSSLDSDSTEESEDDDGDSYAKVTHEPIVGAGGYVQRFDTSPYQESAPDDFYRSEPNLAQDDNVTDQLPNVDASSRIEEQESPFATLPCPRRVEDPCAVGLPSVNVSGYVDHSDISKYFSEQTRKPETGIQSGNELCVPMELDSEDDSSGLSDSGIGGQSQNHGLELPRMPLSHVNGYVQRSDMCSPYQPSCNTDYVQRPEMLPTSHSEPDANHQMPPQPNRRDLDGRCAPYIQHQNLNMNNSNSQMSNPSDDLPISLCDNVTGEISADTSFSGSQVSTIQQDISDVSGEQSPESDSSLPSLVAGQPLSSSDSNPPTFLSSPTSPPEDEHHPLDGVVGHSLRSNLNSKDTKDYVDGSVLVQDGLLPSCNTSAVNGLAEEYSSCSDDTDSSDDDEKQQGRQDTDKDSSMLMSPNAVTIYV